MPSSPSPEHPRTWPQLLALAASVAAAVGVYLADERLFHGGHSGAVDLLPLYLGAKALLAGSMPNDAAALQAIYQAQPAADLIVHGFENYYPPTASILFTPFSLLPFDLLAGGFYWAAVLALLLTAALAANAGPSRGPVAALAAAIAVGAVFLQLRLARVVLPAGQVSPFITCATALALFGLARGRHRLGAGALLLGALVKYFPLVLLPAALAGRRWRYVGAAGVAVLAFLACLAFWWDAPGGLHGQWLLGAGRFLAAPEGGLVPCDALGGCLQALPIRLLLRARLLGLGGATLALVALAGWQRQSREITVASAALLVAWGGAVMAGGALYHQAILVLPALGFVLGWPAQRGPAWLQWLVAAAALAALLHFGVFSRFLPPDTPYWLPVSYVVWGLCLVRLAWAWRVDHRRGDPLLPPSLRRLWPLLLAVLLLVAGLLAWREARAPLPLGVLVAVEGWEEGALDAALVGELEELGFEPVLASDAEQTQLLEGASPAEAARRLRAAFTLHIQLESELSALPGEDGFAELRLQGQLQLLHLGQAEPVAAQALRICEGAASSQQAVAQASEAAARLTLDTALPALLTHSSVQAVLRGSDAALRVGLAPAVARQRAHQAERDGFAQDFGELEAARLASEQGSHDLRFHSAPGAHDRLVAMGTQGLLVASAAGDGAAEILAWRRLDALAGDDDQVLWFGWKIDGYPAASRAGRPVALAEDLFGEACALSLLPADGPDRRLRVARERSFREPRLSPHGGSVALTERACPRCPRELVVLDAASAQERWRLDASAADDIGDFAWLDEERLLVAYRPEQGQGGLWSFDSAGQGEILMRAVGDGRLAQPAAGPDARTVVAVHKGAHVILSLDLDSRALRSHEVGGRASAPSFSPDGQRIVFELVGRRSPHPDIAQLDLVSSQLSAVTRNLAPDRRPLCSPDGQRIFFEAHDRDPASGRAIARIASVRAP